jgi:rare lipoprotein A
MVRVSSNDFVLIAKRRNCRYNKSGDLAMIEALEQWQDRVLDIRFPLREYLGGSENSAVFVTEHTEPEPQRAVIKLVRVDPGQARRELSRAESAAKLSHPGLIRMFQVGLWRSEDLCLLYMVMEYASENLAQVLPGRLLTATEMNEILVSTLDSLQYLHRAGFVHGHLKPANIMAVGNQVKISCDGLCRTGDPGGLRKASIYDPPEALTGTITPAGDVWSLGVITVEALTQQLPARDRTGTELIQPEILPSPFSDIARNCLQPDPKLRWTTNQFADRLRRASSNSVGSADRRLERSTRRRYVLPLAVLGAALAALLIAGKLIYPHSEVRQHVSPLQEQVGSRPAARRVPAQPVQRQAQVADDYRRPSPFGPFQSDRRPIGRPGPIAAGSADRLMAVRESETGWASFFSSSANGALTASGARLNSEDLIAGHANYRLGSRVRVTNLANGKTIEVRIVDRFPDSPKRIINVSAAAARELDFIKAGTAMVRLELVR